jgi:eukaryotic-like serine/threonine-protein kinase
MIEGTKLGCYEIRAKLGAGGMGEVYLAQDTKLDRQVALKVLPAEVAANQDRMRRFVQEAKAAAALNHPNIAHIYEIGEADGLNFIAMEFIEGVTLREKIHSERTELRKLLRYLQHVAEGLAKAHAAGIVHRDLKPDNVMITRDGHAKILDFGLAKLVAPHLAETSESNNSGDAATAIMQQHSTPGVIMGTIGYMSPEQAQGKTNNIDQRSDIFSFGCILFEAVTRHKPFAGDSIVKSLHSLIYEPAPQVKDLNPSAPADLQRIIRRCLAKDPEERYQSIKEVAIELKELRRELETGIDFDTTVPPPVTSEAALSTNSGSTIQSTAAGSASLPPTVSSAEYVVQRLKQHKLSLALTLVFLIGAGFLFAYYMRARSSEVAIDSIAVLPFENKSNASDTEYLSDGLAESLIYRLSQLPNLKVSPTSSVMRYKGKETDLKTIAAELGVSAVMTGRMAQRGDNLTISVELVDVRNNKLLWGEQYERKMSDLLATQREIAASIAQKLQLKLAGNETRGITKRYTDNNEAYQLYLKGRFYFARRTDEDIRRSIDLFQQAIKLDPNFALAYVGVSESYNVMPSYPYMSPNEANPQAKAAVAKALAIDPDLPEAHTVAGMIAATYDWDWVKAEREFKRSLELDPNLAITHYRYAWVYLSPMGRHDEAIAEMKRAMELEPLSLVQGANFAAVYLYARQFDKALDQAKKTYDLDPTMVTGQNWMCHSYDVNGMYAESLAISEKATQMNRSLLAGLGYAYAKSGRRQEAEAVLKQWKEIEKTKYVANYWVAIVYTALGEKDAAFAELEKAYQAHDWFLERLKSDPFMDPLRDDPRFKDLVKRIGLPE